MSTLSTIADPVKGRTLAPLGVRGAAAPRLACAVALCLAALLCSCEKTQPASGQPRSAPPPSKAVPVARDADDAGRFLAGLPGREDSPFADLERLEVWQEHRRSLDGAWTRVENEWMPRMREFQRRELAAVSPEDRAVFYPFSGPDALMASVLFPRTAVYVLVGLEPAGTLTTRARLPVADLANYLADLRDAVASELSKSFFITREMDREFRGQVTDGLFTPILLLLVRTDHTVLGYRYVRLDGAGNVVGRTADYRAPGRIGNKGVEIDFRSGKDQSLHKLYYFSVNLSDPYLRENRPFLTFLSGLNGVTTFLKATSYMPHHPEFSTIRERLLAQSAAVLQDDSGLPYRFFDPRQWRIQLYGEYERPYGSFRWLEQPDLREAFHSPGVRPLGFRIGYGFSKVPSNLLLAVRRGPQPAR